LFAVLGTIVTLLPFLDLEGYAEGIVVAIDVLALLIVSLLLPAKTLKLPMIDGIVISALIAVAVLVSIG